MSKENFIKKIISEEKPNTLFLIADDSQNLIEFTCKFINKTKLTNFQYFHTKVTLFVLENFEKKETIERYRKIRDDWEKVLDILLLDTNSSITIETINSLIEDPIDFIINDFLDFNKNFLDLFNYKKFVDITNIENFDFEEPTQSEIISDITQVSIIEDNEIEQTYNTDKFNHGYTFFYKSHFEKLKNAKNVLEIGISDGSIEYLKSMFTNAQIHGIDILDKSNLNSDRVHTYICDQENREQLQKFIDDCGVKFDLILDDGGHTMKQQQTSFGMLFSQINEGGLYVIENIHTSRLENLGTITKDDIITTLDMLFNYKYTKKVVSNHITDEEKNIINGNISSINIRSENSEYNLGVTSVIQKNGRIKSEIYEDKSDEVYETFDIGITTFSLRFDFVKNLIDKIKNFGVKNKIILCINGEKSGRFDSEYRKKIINLCSNYDDVYPVFFLETRGLSKLWNTLMVHGSSENMLILNDDIELETDTIFESVHSHINSSNYYGLTKINNTFSHFVCNKKFLNTLGYFDERLLGFGEEDGDITYRIIEKYNKQVDNISVEGVINIVSDIRHEYIKSGIGKYSLFNREFMFKEKYNFLKDGNGIQGMFDYPCEKILSESNVYPYEIYFMENKKRL
jgi:hypothetical protein